MNISEVVLNAVCTSGQPDNQCVDTNAACQADTGTTYKCLCKNNFYQNIAGICYASKFLKYLCVSYMFCYKTRLLSCYFALPTAKRYIDEYIYSACIREKDTSI